MPVAPARVCFFAREKQRAQQQEGGNERAGHGQREGLIRRAFGGQPPQIARPESKKLVREFTFRRSWHAPAIGRQYSAPDWLIGWLVDSPYIRAHA